MRNAQKQVKRIYKLTSQYTHLHLFSPPPCSATSLQNNKQLFTEVEVNTGGYLPSRKAAREISTTLYQH